MTIESSPRYPQETVVWLFSGFEPMGLGLLIRRKRLCHDPINGLPTRKTNQTQVGNVRFGSKSRSVLTAWPKDPRQVIFSFGGTKKDGIVLHGVRNPRVGLTGLMKIQQAILLDHQEGRTGTEKNVSHVSFPAARLGPQAESLADPQGGAACPLESTRSLRRRIQRSWIAAWRTSGFEVGLQENLRRHAIAAGLALLVGQPRRPQG